MRNTGFKTPARIRDYPNVLNVKTMFGAKGDGVADDTAAISNAFAAATAKSIIQFPVGTFLLNSSISSSVSDLAVAGSGTIKAGASLGDNPLLDFTGQRVHVSGLKFEGDMSAFSNDPNSLRFGVRFDRATADELSDFCVSDCEFVDLQFAIRVRDVKGGVISNCSFRNTVVNQVARTGASFTDNYCQAIFISGDSSAIVIQDCYAYGYGEFVTSGQRSHGHRVIGNFAELQNDNAVYMEGTGHVIQGNVFENQYQSGVKGFFNRANINGNVIRTTGANTMQSPIFAQALSNVTGQTPDANDSNSYGILISNNVIDASVQSNAIVVTPNPTAGTGYEDAHILNNVIDGKFTNAAAVTGPRGIIVTSSNVTALREKSFGVSIVGNNIRRVLDGINVSADTGGLHKFLTIQGNQVREYVRNGLAITLVDKPSIASNIILNPVGTAVTCNGISATTVTFGLFHGNRIGNTDSDGGQMDNAFLLATSSNNTFVNNLIEGIANFGAHYSGLASSDTIHAFGVRTRTIGGASSFGPSEGPVFLITASAGGVNYNPTGVFPIGHRIIVKNSGVTNAFTFDSAGIAVSIATGVARDFMFDGTVWVEVT